MPRVGGKRLEAFPGDEDWDPQFELEQRLRVELVPGSGIYCSGRAHDFFAGGIQSKTRRASRRQAKVVAQRRQPAKAARVTRAVGGAIQNSQSDRIASGVQWSGTGLAAYADDLHMDGGITHITTGCGGEQLFCLQDYVLAGDGGFAGLQVGDSFYDACLCACLHPCMHAWCIYVCAPACSCTVRPRWLRRWLDLAKPWFLCMHRRGRECMLNMIMHACLHACTPAQPVGSCL